MRFSILLLSTIAITGAQASWFGSDTPTYSSWSTEELTEWLKANNLAPKDKSHSALLQQVKSNWDATMQAGGQWSQDQYNKAQKSFQGVTQATFDTWDESKLREFLLEQGVVAPSGPKEKLIVAAKQKYYQYNYAASSLSVRASATATKAYDTAEGAASTVSASASSLYSATSKSASSIAAAASTSVVRALDDAKDYVYSTWDDAKLRAFLESKGAIVKGKADQTRAELLSATREYYSKAASPVWETWSDSYAREWLIVNGVIEPSLKDAPRATVNAYMKKYYYSLTDTVYDTWSDSQLKGWLIQNNYIKSDAQVNREKMVSLVQDNYAKASDTIWSSWKDSDIRSWLIDNSYLRSDAQVKRDELVKLINDKYTDASQRTAAYLTWPDARLRAYLRQQGITEAALPTGRPGLLQESRIFWIRTKSNAESVYAKLSELLSSGTHAVEDTLGRVLELLSSSQQYTEEKAGDAKKYTGEQLKKGGEQVKKGGERLTGEL